MLSPKHFSASMLLKKVFSKHHNTNMKERRELLMKVYDAALAEYRFNVQLSWDRTKFYITLSVTAIAAGIALFHFAEESKLISLFLSLYFILLLVLSWVGLEAVQVGKRYTREAVFTKTLVERELKLLDRVPNSANPRMHLSIAVTPGMLDFGKVLDEHKERMAKTPFAGSIVGGLNKAFFVIMAIETAGIIVPWYDFLFLVTSRPHASILEQPKPTPMPLHLGYTFQL